MKQGFSDAGLTHIMAVSGANVAFLVFPLLFVFKKLRVGHTAANLLVIGFLGVFVMITGFGPSVLRAVIMAVVILAGKIMKREADIYTTISFSAILLLIYSPYMLFNVGFLLSYAATVSLVMLSRNIKKLIKCKLIPGKVADVLAVTLAAQIGVLPVTVYYFNKLSVISVLTNLLVVPLLEVITIIGMLMALLGQISLVFSRIPGYLNCILLTFVLYVIKISTTLSFSTLRVTTPTLAVIAAYYPTVWYFLWYRPRGNTAVKPKHAAVAVIIAAVIVFPGFLMPGRLEVDFLDVGEGDSAFIRTYTGKTVLLDGGGSTTPDRESGIGETVIVPFLLDKGVNRLDLVIATHGHSDHIQGLVPVMKELKVKNLVIPSVTDEKEFGALLETAGERGVRINRCNKGDVIALDDKTSLYILSPMNNKESYISSLNNTSLVLKLSYGKVDVLFTGDAQTEVEEQLVGSSIDLNADVIKIAHHGSITSTSKAFLERVKPKAAVISVGRNNFGHPSAAVVDLLHNFGIKLFRTDEDGAVILTSGGKGIRMSRTVTEGVKK